MIHELNTKFVIMSLSVGLQVLRRLDINDDDSVRCFACIFSWVPIILEDARRATQAALSDSSSAGMFVQDLRGVLKQLSPTARLRVFVSAACRGGLEVVQMLLPLVDPGYDESVALRLAAANGHMDVVRELIPVSDVSALKSLALQRAAGGGHADVVRALLPYSDARACDSMSLCWAAGHGDIGLVRTLIPLSDVTPRAIRWARDQGHEEVVRELEAARKERGQPSL